MKNWIFQQTSRFCSQLALDFHIVFTARRGLNFRYTYPKYRGVLHSMEVVGGGGPILGILRYLCISWCWFRKTLLNLMCITPVFFGDILERGTLSPPWGVLCFHPEGYFVSTLQGTLSPPWGGTCLHYRGYFVSTLRGTLSPPSGVLCFHPEGYFVSTLRGTLSPPWGVLCLHPEGYFVSTLRGTLSPPWGVRQDGDFRGKYRYPTPEGDL